MHSKYLLVGIVASTVSACSTPEPQAPESNVNETATTAPATVPAQPMAETPPPAATGQDQPLVGNPPPRPLTDEQIAAVVDAANTGEIDQARLAQRKALNSRVKNFAKMMIADHGRAKAQQAELLHRLGVTQVETPRSAAVRDESKRTLQSLAQTTGPEFDRAYIDVQVNEHQHAVDTIDNELIPNARSSDLRASLLDFRPTVIQHLQQAQDIQQELASTPSGISSAGKNDGKQWASTGVPLRE